MIYSTKSYFLSFVESHKEIWQSKNIYLKSLCLFLSIGVLSVILNMLEVSPEADFTFKLFTVFVELCSFAVLFFVMFIDKSYYKNQKIEGASTYFFTLLNYIKYNFIIYFVFFVLTLFLCFASYSFTPGEVLFKSISAFIVGIIMFSLFFSILVLGPDCAFLFDENLKGAIQKSKKITSKSLWLIILKMMIGALIYLITVSALFFTEYGLSFLILALLINIFGNYLMYLSYRVNVKLIFNIIEPSLTTRRSY